MLLWPIISKAIGQPSNPALRHALAELRAWVRAGGHRRDLTARDPSQLGHDQFTQAIVLMDAWWPKLLQAEFQPMLGPDAIKAVRSILDFGGTDFAEGWYGYASKDLRRVFGIGPEQSAYSQAYCGNLPGRHFSAAVLRRRCRTALRASLSDALTVTPPQLYGSDKRCASDPEPACSDANTWTEVSAITIPPFPYQNRPTFQQVVTLTRHLPR